MYMMKNSEPCGTEHITVTLNVSRLSLTLFCIAQCDMARQICHIGLDGLKITCNAQKEDLYMDANL